MKGKKTGLRFIDKIFLWINILFIVLLLLSYLSPHFNPHNGWLIPFFGLGYIFILGFNLLFILYWILRKRWHFLLSLIAILSGLTYLKNNIGFRRSGPEIIKTPDNAIRVITYNVEHFTKPGANHNTSTRHDILQMLNQQQPDIIGFQEYFSKNKGRYDVNDSIKNMLNISNYYFEPFTLSKYRFFGMAIFSKYPIINKGLVPLSDSSSVNQCLFVDLKYNTRIIRYYCVHLRSIGFDLADYEYIDSLSAKGKTDMHSTQRLSTKMINAYLKRSEQVAIVKKHAAQCPYPYIIGGDFNDTPNSYAVTQMTAGLKNAFREKGSGLGRTYNGDFPNFQIDYILTSPQFDIANYKIIEKKLSDHYGVRSDIVLN